MSLPSRERGLKHKIQSGLILTTAVAPLAGAWIETASTALAVTVGVLVAPLAGAWIETENTKILIAYMQSLPSRERGLKHVVETNKVRCAVSLPSRERGLKLVDIRSGIYKTMVAPLAGAWIETRPEFNRFRARKSLPSRERGLKLRFLFQQDKILLGRSPRGSVD